MAPPAHLQAAIFALLACNTIYYIVAGRFSEALESVAWYALLILFLLEAARAQRPLSSHALAVIHGLRLLATLAILASAVLYVREKEWLDATNLFLWVAVVALLEIEIRRPAAVAVHRKLFTVTAALLYAALGILVVIWLTRGEWMDAWDAALWLAAFGVLEMDLLRIDASKNIV
ncbi:MAG: hypothetical protein ABL891_22515 [Burkholderiales bacterium]